MNSILKLIIIWICLCSFKTFPILKNIPSKAPTHNSPVISVSINESDKKTLTIKMQIEKIFLKTNGLTDEQLKPKIQPTKEYFNNHLKIAINDKEQPLQLKSISENKLRVNLTYQIKISGALKNMEVFSDCLIGMQGHDRMPIRISIGTIDKDYRINSERTKINIDF